MEAPPANGPDNVRRDVTEAIHTETKAPEPQGLNAAKFTDAGMEEPQTSKAAPVLSATSGPLNDNPASGYAERVDSSNSAHAPRSEHEAIEDPPFATPMEAPESAFGHVAQHPATAEMATKTT